MAAARVVLIVGDGPAASAVATAFADAGDRVAVTSDLALDHVLTIPADPSSEASVDEAFKALESEVGPAEVAVFVAPAGSGVEEGLTAAYRVARRAAQKMLRARKGRIVLVTPAVLDVPTGAGRPGGGRAGAAASKAATVGFARTLAREIGKRSITVNVVACGVLAPADAAAGELVALTPLARAVEPAEVAAAVVFLASEGAAAITGAVLPVDAGLVMG